MARANVANEIGHRTAIADRSHLGAPDFVGEGVIHMSSESIQFHKIWIDQCEATEGIREHFGLQNALDYLIGEKLSLTNPRHLAIRERTHC
jgi:hypothetical protein